LHPDLATAANHAQILYGSLTGRVTDPSGGGIGSVVVTVTSKQTGAQREAKSDASGTYEIPILQPGVYDLKILAPIIRRCAHR
jgi:hypothetical protein